TDLRPLSALTGMMRLDLAGCTALSDLGPLGALRELETLSFYGCESVSDLSPLFGLSQLGFINLTETPVSLPDHLWRSGDAQAIFAWIREESKAAGKRPLAEVKLLLVGQGRVGKTHLRRRLFEDGGIGFHDPGLDRTQHVDCVHVTRPLPPGHPTGLGAITF